MLTWLLFVLMENNRKEANIMNENKKAEQERKIGFEMS
ncbi:hypothetical protein CHCC14431_2706 [Bacillus licheniformis]|nr:hypothetical protein CHCC14431_2706 [Bacillus licheniformis]